MNKLRVLVADEDEETQNATQCEIFRLNPLEWWAGYDLTSVRSAYLGETRVANEEAFDEEEELPREAMNTLRIYSNPYRENREPFKQNLPAWWLKVTSSLAILLADIPRLNLKESIAKPHRPTARTPSS